MMCLMGCVTRAGSVRKRLSTDSRPVRCAWQDTDVLWEVRSSLLVSLERISQIRNRLCVWSVLLGRTVTEPRRLLSCRAASPLRHTVSSLQRIALKASTAPTAPTLLERSHAQSALTATRVDWNLKLSADRAHRVGTARRRTSLHLQENARLVSTACCARRRMRRLIWRRKEATGAHKVSTALVGRHIRKPVRLERSEIDQSCLHLKTARCVLRESIARSQACLLPTVRVRPAFTASTVLSRRRLLESRTAMSAQLVTTAPKTATGRSRALQDLTNRSRA